MRPDDRRGPAVPYAHAHAPWRSLAVGALLLASCAFDATTPEGATITCGGGDDCPDGLVCSAFLSRCVPISGDGEPPVLTRSALSSTRLSGADVLHATLEVDEPLEASSLLQVGGAQYALVRSDDDPLLFTVDVPAGDLGSGVYAVSALLVDALGNAGAALLGTVEIDTDAPGIEPGSVRIDVTTPPGVIATDDPALAVGGSVEVAFRLDDLGGDATGVVLRANGTELLSLALTARDAIDFVFAAGLDAAADEGTYDVVAFVRDAVGNEADVVIGVVRVAGSATSQCLAVHGDGAPVCTDADVDGAFGPGPGCAEGEATDCDDTRPLVFPGAIDLPDNGLDEDCDGTPATFDDEGLLARSIFVAPGASSTAAGTREDPLGDLLIAAARTATMPDRERSIIFAQAGTYDIGDVGLELQGSLVGGLDASFTERVGTSTIENSFGVGMSLYSTQDMLISGVTLRGRLCNGIFSDPDWLETFLALEDVHIDSNDDGTCYQSVAYYIDSRPIRMHGCSVRMARDLDGGELRAISTDEQVYMSDTDVRIECESCVVSGIRTERGTVARTRILLAGDSPVGFYTTEAALVSSEIVVTAMDGSYLGPDGMLADEGDVIHSTIEVHGVDAIGIRSGGGRIVANDLVVTGANSVALRIEDYGLGGPDLHANRFAFPDDGCAVRFGREDLTCVSLESCPQCASVGQNTVAPDAPAPLAAVDLGAPSTIALDLDGTCRGDTSPIGADEP